MTDLHGKTALVTGATNGIGKVTALELARMGAAVTIISRSAERTAAAAAEIRAATGNSAVDYLVADLSLTTEVRRVAQEYLDTHPRLEILVNNAGVYYSERQLTAEGYERTFALNHLNYFLLTHLLLDLLRSSAPARIVNVSSAAHLGASLDFDDLQTERYGSVGFKAYGRSKLANVMFTYALARRLAGSGVTANALHPGGVNTGFGKNNGGLVRLGMNLFGRFALTPEQGAQTSIYLASSPEVEGVSGKYWANCKAESSSPVSYDEAAQERLWQISLQMTGLAIPS